MVFGNVIDLISATPGTAKIGTLEGNFARSRINATNTTRDGSVVSGGPLRNRRFFGNAKEYDNRNEYGIRLGGPIVKNKTFFFGFFEGQRVKRVRQTSYSQHGWMHLPELSHVSPGS